MDNLSPAQLPIHNLNPEDEELGRKRARLAELEAELTERELKRADLLAKLNFFEKRYLEVVGRRYAELDRLEAQVASLLARQKPNDREAQDRAEAARNRARESAQAAGSEAAETAPEKTRKRSDELNKLYRQAAKAMHPDLTLDPDERERRLRVMKELNAAYAEGDEERVRSILRDWQASPENIQGDGPGAELVRIIRKIAQVENRLRTIAEEISQLRQGELFKLRQAVKEARAEGQNLLAAMAQKVDGEIAEARLRLDALRRKGTV